MIIERIWERPNFRGYDVIGFGIEQDGEFLMVLKLIINRNAQTELFLDASAWKA